MKPLGMLPLTAEMEVVDSVKEVQSGYSIYSYISLCVGGLKEKAGI